jgi:hypothetical protein
MITGLAGQDFWEFAGRKPEGDEGETLEHPATP